MTYWSNSYNNEYRVNEPRVEPSYRRDHHNKGHNHVSYRTIYEEPVIKVVEEAYYPKAREPERETTFQRYQRARHGDHSAFESVDQEADAFLRIEHKRMEKFISIRDDDA
ncbi:hypothetical protein RIF29_42267 [Crotalaria pallida]|uniref:Uncharacterized protein n=1 Tax=Crotalaria pallida TaxID=3830 RepID=A0AAN9E6L6_CROPI